MNDFETQREIYEWLLVWGKLRVKDTGEIVFFDGDSLNELCNFNYPENWEKVIEPQVVEFECMWVNDKYQKVWHPVGDNVFDKCESMQDRRWKVRCEEIVE